METQVSTRKIVEMLAKLQSEVDTLKIKVEEIGSNEDNFSDVVKLTEESLKEVWDNEEDEVWNEYLKE